MPRKKTYITVTDQFCGAGGSSQGARAAGCEIKLALNHWQLAIETHNTNFPDTDHDCTDISACDPRRYNSTDILITSPECTNHSLAKGVKRVKKQLELFDKGILDASAERSRATMWDVPRFAEYHNYNIIIVENVVDASKWVMFEAWLQAMHLLGYDHKCCYFNSMHFWPTPQSRNRMYIVFWKKGNKRPDLSYHPLAACPKCGKDIYAVQSWKKGKKAGKYHQQYVYCCPNCSMIVEPYYYAAFNCIDWSDVGTKIGDRAKPLSPNTIRRIEYGLQKYGREPLIVNDQHSTGIECRVNPISGKLPTIPGTHHLSLCSPFIVKEEHTSITNVRSAFDQYQTQTTRQSMSLIVPWIIEMNRTGEAKPATMPTATITAGGINHAILVENKGQSKSKPVSSACGTITTKSHLGLLTTTAFNSFISYYYNGSYQATSVSEEIKTITTKDRCSLISNIKTRLEDCHYRMLKAHEIKLAMAFSKDYIVIGNSRDKVRQLGNAVTPPVMEWIIKRCVESLN